MFLNLAKRLMRLSLFTPLIIAPFFIGETFVFPASFFFPFISPKVFFFRFVVGAALGSLILHLILSTTRTVQLNALWRKLKHPVALSVICFGIVFFITALLGENPGPSVWSNFERGEGAFQILHYCAFFLLLFVLFTNKNEIRKLIRLNVFVSVLVSLYAVTQLPILNGVFGTIGNSVRISGTMGNPSYLAAYLLINFALIAYLFLTSTSKKARGWLLAIALLEFFVLLGTGTRAAYLGLIVGLIAVYLTTIITTPSARLRRNLLIVGTASILCLIGLITAYRASPALQKSYLLGRLLDVKNAASGFGPRTWTWQSAVSGIKERPMLGWGAENFPYSFDKHYDPRHYGIESFFDRTHNVFLEYLISGGLILLIAYLAIWFFYYRSLKGHQKNLWYSILLATPLMYFTQAFFLFDVLPIYLIIFFFLAISINLTAAPENSQIADDGYEIGHIQMLSSIIICAALIFLFFIGIVFPMKKNLLISRAFSTPANGLRDAFNAYQAAVTYSSLVGQEEAVSALAKFSVNFLEAAAAQKVEIPRDIIQGIVDTNNGWYDQYRHTFAGVRQAYLNGGLNLRAGLSFGFPEYASRGLRLYQESLEYAPTRIEFIKVLIDAANATQDQEALRILTERGRALRPDLAW